MKKYSQEEIKIGDNCMVGLASHDSVYIHSLPLHDTIYFSEEKVKKLIAALQKTLEMLEEARQMDETKKTRPITYERFHEKTRESMSNLDKLICVVPGFYFMSYMYGEVCITAVIAKVSLARGMYKHDHMSDDIPGTSNLDDGLWLLFRESVSSRHWVYKTKKQAHVELKKAIANQFKDKRALGITSIH